MEPRYVGLQLPTTNSEWSDFLSFGSYILDLISDWSWIKRRVETVHLTDLDKTERRVTLDISVDELRRRCARYGLPEADGVVVPFAFLKKGLFLDFDLFLDGKPSSLAVSTEDSSAGQAAILAAMMKAATPSVPSEQIARAAYDIALKHPSDEDLVALDLYEFFGGSGPLKVPMWNRSDFSSDDRAVWRDVADDPGASDTLIRYSTQFMMVIVLPHDSPGTSVLKYRLVEFDDFLPALNVRQRLGINPVHVRASHPAVGQAGREHFRVVAPDGASIGDPELRNRGRLGTSAGDDERRKYMSKAAHERIVVYTRDPPAASSYEVVFKLLPNAPEFWFASMILTASSAFGLLTAVLTGLTSSASPGPVAPLLLGVLSLSFGFIIRLGDHPILAKLLRFWRTLLLTAAVLTISAVFALVLKPAWVGLGELWLGCAVANFTLFALLAFSRVRIGVQIRSMRSRFGIVYRKYVEVHE